jgi:hypothetical protein
MDASTGTGSAAENRVPVPAKGAALAITHADAASRLTGLLAGWNGAVLVTVGYSLLGALAVIFARERSAFSRTIDLHT